MKGEQCEMGEIVIGETCVSRGSFTGLVIDLLVDFEELRSAVAKAQANGATETSEIEFSLNGKTKWLSCEQFQQLFDSI